jgi:hypothetical protein
MICGRGYWALGPFFVSGLRHISSSLHALQHEPHDARGPPPRIRRNCSLPPRLARGPFEHVH